MTDVVRDVQNQEGFHRYQDAAAKLKPAQYPWGTLLANVGGIAAAHAAGFVSAGALAKILAESRLGERFARLPLPHQRLAVMQAVAIAGSVGTVAAGLAHLAGQMRVAEAVKAKVDAAPPGTKVAAVHDIYTLAARGLLDE